MRMNGERSELRSVNSTTQRFSRTIFELSLARKSMVLLGFRHLAPSIPSIRLTGVAIGVGVLPAFSALPTRRNPPISNSSVR